ncbi:beta-phosphoglucomutase family hydrolase [Mycolicibacter acidiphilus]|uniref:beta-phosphoglucomutase family hydrolase n=1 Tax=Mycolicibacter acidiphilus TaxID=2835306 RepID=UPI00355730A4
MSELLGLPGSVHACLFDLDGVLTDTASVHTAAWQAMFDAFLAQRDGPGFTPFDPVEDYRRYVDGRKRDDGVRAFLASRDITLPDGDADDPPEAETVYGLGNRKNAAFAQTLRDRGAEVFEGSRRYLQAVVAAGLPTAVVSASANAGEVLRVTGLAQFINCRVDGVTLRTEHLPGKPAPDSFLRAAQLLGVAPDHGAVFEDALSGVAAGRAGGFGFVVGVDRVGQAAELSAAGADVVVDDLAELLREGER